MKSAPRTLASLLLSLAVACGGGGSSDSSGGSESTPTEPTDPTETVDPTDPVDPTEPADPSPSGGALTVDAGYGRVAPSGVTVRLGGSVSGAVDVALRWTQLSGTPVDLDDATTESPSLVTPTLAESEHLVFELEADDGVNEPVTDRVTVEVWVSLDTEADPTLLGDFTALDGWACDVDPAVAPELTVTVSDEVMTYSGNGIPDHATGTFPNGGNPNSIGVSSRSFDIPLNPVRTDVATEMAEFGITLDGVKLERDTAESYRNEGEWRYEAITPGLALQSTAGAEWNWLGTDCNNAHVQPTGAYHYHGLPETLINRLGETADAPVDMMLGGYAADGFPIYLRYGYADAMNPDSGLVVVEGSWELREGTRSGGPGGAYDGTFRNDWEFVEGTGDLDECGGRFGVTPEFPDGIYHYYLTDDYPYIPRCVFGTPSGSFRSMGGGGPMP